MQKYDVHSIFVELFQEILAKNMLKICIEKKHKPKKYELKYLSKIRLFIILLICFSLASRYGKYLVVFILMYLVAIFFMFDYRHQKEYKLSRVML